MRTILLILLAAGTLSLAQSCRKAQLREMENTGNIPLSCSNGTYDSDELDLDCGGECEPCAAGTLDAPCAPNNNSITIDSYTYTFGSASADSASTYDMFASGSQGSISIKLNTTPPLTDKKIYYIGSSAYDINKATITLNLSSFLTYGASSGKIYTERVNGKVRVTFCNITFGSSFGTSTGTGRLTTY
jgi:hypothetical protein